MINSELKKFQAIQDNEFSFLVKILTIRMVIFINERIRAGSEKKIV
jgi:type III secretory pathway component EscS